jgi:membrane protein DedA with SNARE-associated domain
MQVNASRILFLAKLTVSFMIPSLISAGLVKVPWRRWFPALFAGEMIWTGSLVLIGYYAAEAIKHIQPGVEFFIFGLSLVFLLFLLWMGRALLRKRLNGHETGQGLSNKPHGNLIVVCDGCLKLSTHP